MDDIWPPQGNKVKISIVPQDSSENDRQEGSETAISNHLRFGSTLALDFWASIGMA
jgi:hypothetical protein